MQKVQRWSQPCCTSTKARARPSNPPISWPAVSRTDMMSLTRTVGLPAVAAAPPAAAGPVARSPAAGRILLVDDEPHILHYMRATLTAWGHAVDVATDGEEAIARALEGRYDLIITDVRMPNLGGRELYERLHRDAPEVAARVVFSTGDTVRDDTLTFLEGAGRPVLHKPFKLAELRQLLASALCR